MRDRWDERHPDVPRERVRDLYEAGFSISEVARELGVPRSSTYMLLRRMGVEFRPAHAAWATRLPHEELVRTAFMYERMEMSSGEIAAALGLNQETVISRLRKHGVKMRSRSEALRVKWARAGGRGPGKTWAETGRTAYRKAPAQGLEPRSADQQSAVLPLDDAGEGEHAA